jgi:hypothetical protein
MVIKHSCTLEILQFLSYQNNSYLSIISLAEFSMPYAQDRSRMSYIAWISASAGMTENRYNTQKQHFPRCTPQMRKQIRNYPACSPHWIIPYISQIKITLSKGKVKGFFRKIGMSKEHRIPLRKIRCMIPICYQKPKKMVRGQGRACSRVPFCFGF